MKKTLFLALSLAFLLTACGETTLPDTSEQNPVDNTQETSLPESCLLYYDLGDASILAEDKSLPLAQNAGDGYQTSYSVWYDGEYQDLALQDGDSGISVADMTGGSAVFDYGAGLVVWNGERYHCAHLTAQDSYIPNISPNIPGGILLLEVSGDCWADGGVSAADVLLKKGHVPVGDQHFHPCVAGAAAGEQRISELRPLKKFFCVCSRFLHQSPPGVWYTLGTEAETVGKADAVEISADKPTAYP